MKKQSKLRLIGNISIILGYIFTANVILNQTRQHDIKSTIHYFRLNTPFLFIMYIWDFLSFILKFLYDYPFLPWRHPCSPSPPSPRRVASAPPRPPPSRCPPYSTVLCMAMVAYTWYQGN